MSSNERYAFPYEEKVEETDKAVLLEMPDENEIWLPLSQVEIDEVDQLVTLPEWLASNEHFFALYKDQMIPVD